MGWFIHLVKWEERGLINSKRKELVHAELVKQVPDNLLLPTEIARVHKKGHQKKKKKNPVTAQGTKDTKKMYLWEYLLWPHKYAGVVQYVRR